MQFLNYFLASIISFLGLLIGIILIKIAPEEQKPLYKYFKFAEKILLFLIFIFLAFFYYKKLFFILVLIMYLILLLIVGFKSKDEVKKSMIAYTTFGVLFYLSSTNLNLFAVESSLILLYGLPMASLLYNVKEKNYFKVSFYNIGFLIISNLLYFI